MKRNRKNMGKSAYMMLMSVVMVLLLSCNDFLDITPTGKVIPKTLEEYRALLTYEYKYMPKDRSLTVLRGDELTLSPTFTSDLDYDTYFDLWRWNDNAPATTTTYYGWRRYYHAIYIANYIIAHQQEIAHGTAAEVRQLVGEAYMMRAYHHFLLANLYAAPYNQVDPVKTRGIPVMTVADVDAMPRSSSLKAVYDQILSDIDAAGQLLNVEKWEIGKNYRFNTAAVHCLRARVNLYMGNWQAALDASKMVLDMNADLEDFNSSDAKLPNLFTSKENILALEPNMPADHATIGRPSVEFIAGKYKSGDLRRTKYYRRVTSSTYDLLKGGKDEFVCSFRTAEFYLIAAETCARLGQAEAAIDFLSKLMEKRYNPTVCPTYLEAIRALSAEELVEEILDERCRELAFEGHRWFDLRRTTMPELTKTYKDESFRLSQGDQRYTLKFPSEAVEANPEIEIWNE